MSSREGMQVNLEELLRNLGEEPLLKEAEALGLSPKGRRARCPFECAGDGKERPRNATIHGKHPRLACFKCGKSGDLVDLLQVSRGWTKPEAIAHLTGIPVQSRPPLQLVHPPTAEDPDKLSPAEVRRIWDGLALEDEVGQQYLEKRGLGDAVELGLVRFATEAHEEKGLRSYGKRGYRVAVLLQDVVGNHRGIQLRSVGQLKSGEPKILSVKGSTTGKAFFGSPELVEASAVVCVAEGLADTLALATWLDVRQDSVVVGAAGKNSLHLLADELAAAGVTLAGKVFALFPQNDRPKNASRKEFVRLVQKLKALGAECQLIAIPEEFKDVAEWRQRFPDMDWPPPELARVLLPEPGDDSPRVAQPILSPGCAIAIPQEIRTDTFAQNFSTLCALLDDPVHREPIMGRGELSWCQMRQTAVFGGRPLVDSDLFAIRLGLESQSRSTDGKPLKFPIQDIEQALHLVAHKKPIHPVRDWLSTLEWDRKQRLDSELPLLMGHHPASFAGTLLRRWLVSAVARAMEPGCKADCVLVLVGPQAAKKTTFLKALGGDWYTPETVTPGDKDGKLIMRGAWIIEWGELEAMRRARDQESIKNFLSQQVDTFRPHYGRRLIEAPRSSVIAGTTNTPHYLSDPTGNRRFWTVNVLRPIDVNWTRENRAQLFAEALAIFRGAQACATCRPLLPDDRCAMHRWWLTGEEEDELRVANTEHEEQDVWHDLIEDWLELNPFKAYVTTAEVLAGAIDKDEDNWSPNDSKRVAAVLKQLGWKLERDGSGHGQQRRRLYARPA